MEAKDSKQDLAIELPPSLQRRLDKDADFVRHGRIVKLPAKCSVLAVLEAFIRWKVYTILSEFVSERPSAENGDTCELRSAAEARQFRKQIAFERVRFLIEVADALRVCFDNLLPVILLRKEERDAYELFEEKVANLNAAEQPSRVKQSPPKANAKTNIKIRCEPQCDRTNSIHSGKRKSSNALESDLEKTAAPNCRPKRARTDSGTNVHSVERDKATQKRGRPTAERVGLLHATRSTDADAGAQTTNTRSRRGENNHNHANDSHAESKACTASPCTRPADAGSELSQIETAYFNSSHSHETSLLLANGLNLASDQLNVFVDTICSTSWHMIAHPSWVLQGGLSRREFVRPSLLFGTTHLLRLLSKLTMVRRAQLDAVVASGRPVLPKETAQKAKAKADPKAKTQVKAKVKAKTERPAVQYDRTLLERFCVAETSCVLRELIDFLAKAADGAHDTPPNCRLVAVAFETEADYVSVGEQCAYFRRTCALELYTSVLSGHFRCCGPSKPLTHAHARNGTARQCAPLCNRPLMTHPVS